MTVRRRLNDALGSVILAAWGAWCWLARIPHDNEQARRWQDRRL